MPVEPIEPHAVACPGRGGPPLTRHKSGVHQEAGFAPDWQRVETESDYLAQLDPPPDVILADYALPHFSGLEALRLLRERSLTIPFILITGAAGEEAAVNALQKGADDYLLKDRLARLGRAVKRALEQQALRKEKQRIERVAGQRSSDAPAEERAARAEAEAESACATSS